MADSEKIDVESSADFGDSPNPRVFFDIEIDGDPGTVVA